MKSRVMSGLWIAIAMAIITPTAWAQVFFPYPNTLQPVTGFYAILNEPGKTFHEARLNFLDEAEKNAAAAIRKGAAFVKIEEASATKEIKDALVASENELEKLAQAEEKGAINSAHELDEAFARAHQTLARSYIFKASEAWTKKETAKAGQYLKAAISHLNNALAWSGQKLESSTVTAIKKSRVVAGKLIEGTGYGSKEVGKTLETVGNEIDQLGKKVEPVRK
jgi:hypothetical protein